MNKEALERSEQAFYQYEARKVLDYLKEKNLTQIEPDSKAAKVLDLRYKTSISIDDPRVLFDVGEFLKRAKIHGQVLINDFENPPIDSAGVEKIHPDFVGKPETAELLRQPVSIITFSKTKFGNAFHRWARRNNINMVGDLIKYTKYELSHEKSGAGLGPKAIEELNKWLIDNGLPQGLPE